jgi:hypothetical protein
VYNYWNTIRLLLYWESNTEGFSIPAQKLKVEVAKRIILEIKWFLIICGNGESIVDNYKQPIIQYLKTPHFSMHPSTLEITYHLVGDPSNLCFSGWFANVLEFHCIKSVRNHPTIHLQPIHHHSIFSPCVLVICVLHLLLESKREQ